MSLVAVVHFPAAFAFVASWSRGALPELDFLTLIINFRVRYETQTSGSALKQPLQVDGWAEQRRISPRGHYGPSQQTWPRPQAPAGVKVKKSSRRVIARGCNTIQHTMQQGLRCINTRTHTHTHTQTSTDIFQKPCIFIPNTSENNYNTFLQQLQKLLSQS